MLSINMLIVTLYTYISYSCTRFILISDYACSSFIYVSLVTLLLCFFVSLFDVVKGGDRCNRCWVYGGALWRDCLVV